MPLPPLIFVVVSVIKSLIILIVLLTAVAYTVWLERKVVGRMQNRWGPTRVGPFGLLQPAADGLKFLFKEDLTPPHVYKPLFLAAPMIAVIFARQYWTADHSGRDLDGRLWRGAGGVVLE